LPEGYVVISTIAQEFEEGKKHGIQQGCRQGILDAIEADLEFAFGVEGSKEMTEKNRRY